MNNPMHKKMDVTKRITTRVGVILLVVLALWVHDQISSSGLLDEGTQAPLWSLTKVDGSRENLDLNDLRGKVVVLDFWSPYCSPCLKEMDELEKIWSDTREKNDVVVVGISLQVDDILEVEQFASQRKVAYPMVFGSESVAEVYKVQALPSLYVLDRYGKVVESSPGFWGATGIQRAINKARAIQ